jgi:aspartyl aminopeptidase
MPLPPHARQTARDLIAFIDASPSPWHAVAGAEQHLQAAGFSRLEEGARWSLVPGGRHYVLRGGASLIAFTLGSRPLAEAGFRIVGAHTDSPGLRLKPRPVLGGDGLARLAVEVYGGPILATFADRDLSLAGRVMLRGAAGPQARLLRFDRPLLRLPNLAIHMNREVNEAGLKFDKQTELPLLLGLLDKDGDADPRLRELLAAAVQCAPDDLLSWELAAYDVQLGSLWGADEEFIASRQLDNLASCHAALAALTAVSGPAATTVAALFDHEEVGSESAAGAGGSFVGDVLARIGLAQGLDGEDRRRALANSFFVSADMAHAYNPNFPAAYEPGHKVMVNGGPVIKSNANQRYTTDRGHRGALHGPVPARRRALPAVRASRQSRLRQYHRPRRRGPAGHCRRRCRLADVGHAQRPRKRRRARSGLDDRRTGRLLPELIGNKQGVPHMGTDPLPLDADTVQILSGVTTATLTTVLLKKGLRNVWMRGARPLQTPPVRVVGRAFTLRFVPAREDLATPASWASPISTRAAIEAMPAGCIAVVDALGVTDAGIFGDILCGRMQKRGVAALVSDGVVRDVQGVMATGLPVWCQGTAAPASVAGLTFVGWQEPVGCGGVAVFPNDVVVADADGAIVIPAALLAEVIAEAMEQERMEAWILAEVAAGVPLPGLYPPNEETKARYAAWVRRQG